MKSATTHQLISECRINATSFRDDTREGATALGLAAIACAISELASAQRENNKLIEAADEGATEVDRFLAGVPTPVGPDR